MSRREEEVGDGAGRKGEREEEEEGGEEMQRRSGDGEIERK